MSFWTPNLDRNGRLLRMALGGVTLAAALALVQDAPRWLTALTVLWAVFCLFQGIRGWCPGVACRRRFR